MTSNDTSPAPAAPAQPGMSNIGSMPLANIPLTTSGPLSDAHKQLVIDSILPIVLAAAKQQRPDKPITPDKLLELKAKFTDDLCRWWINKAHEVKREYLARGLPLPGAKRELEGDVEGQGREKRAKIEEDDERDVEMLVDAHTRTQSVVTGEVLSPPAFSEPASPSKEDDVDMFSPPEVPSEPAKSVDPSEEEEPDEIDMDLDSDVDESPPPPPPVLASKQPTPASEAPTAPDKPDVSSAGPSPDAAPVPQPSTAEEQRPILAFITAPPKDPSPVDVPPPPEAPDGSPTVSRPTPASQTAPEPVADSAQTSVPDPSPQPDPASASAQLVSPTEPTPASASTIAAEPGPAAAETIAEPIPPEPELVYATVPGIWGIKPGMKTSTTLEFELVIDDATYDAARRWAARWDTFTDGPADSFVSVRLHCLPIAQVQELDAEVRAGSRPSAPADVADAMAKLSITWPALGTLMITNGKQSLCGDIFKPGTPLDVSSLIQPGINTLRLFLIGASHMDKVYALHATQPSADETRAVAEVWRAQKALIAGAERGVTSFGIAQLAGGGTVVEAAA
ncbi:unnamed protein product [Peniophora sp. CBMAI 1063]|nr:unnamed protein product [Peniophora sp. CBMAI 1063]